MDQIKEMLDRLGDLSSEELDSLESAILGEFDALEKIEPENLQSADVETMTSLADSADALRAERTRRDEASAALSAAREAAVSKVRGPSEDVADKTDEKPADADASTSELSSTDPTAQLDDLKDIPEGGKSDSEITEQHTGEKQTTHPDSSDLKQEKDTGVIQGTDQVDTIDDPAAPGSEDGKPADAKTDEASANTDADADSNSQVHGKDDSTDKTDTEKESTVTASLDIPDNRRPVAKTKAPITITAGGDIQGFAAGGVMPDMRAVAEAITRRSHAMRKTTGGDGEQQTIATLTASFPEDRILSGSNPPETNFRLINAVTSPEALTAAGGLCAPVDVSYDIFGLEGSTARPVRDALAVFSADRGGIRFVTPPVLADLAGAVSVWTLQDDQDAATAGAPNPIKPCLRVDCGDEVTVYTDAIPLCLTFGNLGARAWPELVERHLELGMVEHARFAETRLITRIGALSTAVTAAAELGAARDIFNQLDAAAAGYRNRYRMDAQAPLRAIFPEWFKNALRSDLVKQLPGDGQESTFALADNFMSNWFNVRHINVSWQMDGEAGQQFGAQAIGALLSYPESLIWYLFAEGTFIFLDGGTLDLGLVRDSVLNGTNDYKIFLETFEGVAKVGVESLKITSELKIAGASAATVDTITVTP